MPKTKSQDSTLVLVLIPRGGSKDNRTVEQVRKTGLSENLIRKYLAPLFRLGAVTLISPDQLQSGFFAFLPIFKNYPELNPGNPFPIDDSGNGSPDQTARRIEALVNQVDCIGI